MKLLQLFHSICYQISGDMHLARTVPPVQRRLHCCKSLGFLLWLYETHDNAENAAKKVTISSVR